uniref:Ubiquitin-like domain-containing protein n=1 Tax=Amphora coffeiformis TaxID=265554 RepID=A0A7S3KZU4_9STRA
MTTDTAAQQSETISVTLKWNKQVFSLAIPVGEGAVDFKRRVQAATGVPLHRQKLMTKKGWKGPLKDDATLDAATVSSTPSIIVTLIGSAETLADGPSQKTTFIEDLTPEELQAAEEAQAQAAMTTAEGMIPVLQLPPHRRDDEKQEMYQYNRLVTGLPQRQIEQELRKQQKQKQQGETLLQGNVVMNLGLELRRAYINDLAVLVDGTCVSALDDGHVQLWKHGAQQQDIVHAPGAEGGVDSVVALKQQHSNYSSATTTTMAFATAGRGSIQFWSAAGDAIISLGSGMPGTTPSSLVAVYGGIGQNNDDGDDDYTITCLAARYHVTRQVNPSQFHLPPRTEEERRRRALAEAQERMVQENLGKAARSVQILYSIQRKDDESSQTFPRISSKILDPSSGPEGAAPITCLACVFVPGQGRFLVAGDTQGGLRIWRALRSTTTSSSTDIEFTECGFYQMTPPSSGCRIVCMEPLSDGRLAVATDSVHSTTESLLGATALPTQAPRAVHILDFSGAATAPRIQSTLTGHSQDAVICMCQLPDGGLLTGGGKLDATLQLWSCSQVKGKETYGDDSVSTVYAQSSKVLSDVGYVFALAVLTDAKNDSSYYAVAAGRYNTVKIII